MYIVSNITDAAIHFVRDENFVVSEYPDDETGEVCVVISDLPSGGLGCDLIAYLSTGDGTKSMLYMYIITTVANQV